MKTLRPTQKRSRKLPPGTSRSPPGPSGGSARSPRAGPAAPRRTRSSRAALSSSTLRAFEKSKSIRASFTLHDACKRVSQYNTRRMYRRVFLTLDMHFQSKYYNCIKKEITASAGEDALIVRGAELGARRIRIASVRELQKPGNKLSGANLRVQQMCYSFGVLAKCASPCRLP